MAVATQLRRYTVSDKEGLDRLAAWFPGLVPVREQHGFTIEWAYTDYENLQFVWAVSHPGDFDAAVEAYYASPERAALSEGFDNPITEMVVGFVEPCI